MPTLWDLIVAGISMTLYATAGGLACVGRWRGRLSSGAVAMWYVGVTGGVVFNLLEFKFRWDEGHGPISSGFDTFLALALLSMAALFLYVRLARAPAEEPIPPAMAAACLAAAMALSGEAYRDFAGGVWNVAHVASAVAAAACLAAATACGGLYLRAHRRLRGKDPAVVLVPMASLERLERLVRRLLPAGFALLTVTLATGAVEALHHERYLRAWWTHPKVLTAGITWVVYALALHAAFAGRFRARAAAGLSAAGLLLLLAVLLASTLMPRA